MLNVVLGGVLGSTGFVGWFCVSAGVAASSAENKPKVVVNRAKFFIFSLNFCYFTEFVELTLLTTTDAHDAGTWRVILMSNYPDLMVIVEVVEFA